MTGNPLWQADSIASLGSVRAVPTTVTAFIEVTVLVQQERVVQACRTAD
jgi:hypothetical protein